jgi:hypothetical protein
MPVPTPPIVPREIHLDPKARLAGSTVCERRSASLLAFLSTAVQDETPTLIATR